MINVRKIKEKDFDKVIDLLNQVLDVHIKIRPDIFKKESPKYNKDELKEYLNNEVKFIDVAVDENDEVVGYAFLELRNSAKSSNLIPFKTLFIDDLCVDKNVRGKHIGTILFEYIKKEAKELGCYELTLNVWEGNDSAYSFYKKEGMKVKETQLELILDK